MKNLMFLVSLLFLLAGVAFTACSSEEASSEDAAATVVVDESKAETIKLAVNGMTCQGCQSSITQALAETNGVVSGSVVVSLDDNTAEMKYDPAVASTDDLINAVKEAGYEASVGE